MSHNPTGQFALLTFAGLAEITERELNPSTKTDIQVHRLPNYDLIELSLSETDISRLPLLRTVEDVFLLMGRLPLSKKIQLHQLPEKIQKEQLLMGIRLKNRLFHPIKPKQPSFKCFVKQDRDHSIYRRTIAQQMEAAVAQVFPKWKIRDPSSVEIWGFYIRQNLHLAFRLSDNRLRYRAKSPPTRPGALRPTVAAAMIKIADLLPTDIVIDPMCGTGTILAEIIQQRTQSSTNLRGGDIDRKAIELAQRRFSKYDLSLQHWEARELPIEQDSVDCIICNLPFGQQFSSIQKNKKLYSQLITDWVKRLKNNGRMVLLTADTKRLENVLNQQKLRWKNCWRAKVLGNWASVYLVTLK